MTSPRMLNIYAKLLIAIVQSAELLCCMLHIQLQALSLSWGSWLTCRMFPSSAAGWFSGKDAQVDALRFFNISCTARSEHDCICIQDNTAALETQGLMETHCCATSYSHGKTSVNQQYHAASLWMLRCDRVASFQGNKRKDFTKHLANAKQVELVMLPGPSCSTVDASFRATSTRPSIPIALGIMYTVRCTRADTHSGLAIAVQCPAGKPWLPIQPAGPELWVSTSILCLMQTAAPYLTGRQGHEGHRCWACHSEVYRCATQKTRAHRNQIMMDGVCNAKKCQDLQLRHVCQVFRLAIKHRKPWMA